MDIETYLNNSRFPLYLGYRLSEWNQVFCLGASLLALQNSLMIFILFFQKNMRQNNGHMVQGTLFIDLFIIAIQSYSAMTTQWTTGTSLDNPNWSLHIISGPRTCRAISSVYLILSEARYLYSLIFIIRILLDFTRSIRKANQP